MRCLRTLACAFLQMCLVGLPIAAVLVGLPLVIIPRELSHLH